MRSLFDTYLTEVATLRAHGFDFLCLSRMQADGITDIDITARRTAILDRYVAAIDFVSGPLGSLAQRHTGLAQPVQAALSVLRDMETRFRRLLDTPDDGEFTTAYKLHVESFFPAISTLLATLEKTTNEEEAGKSRAMVDTTITKIEQINSTINLIAVNASIEAARAGTAGTGFAVISSEIKTLSQRSRETLADLRGRLD